MFTENGKRKNTQALAILTGCAAGSDRVGRGDALRASQDPAAEQDVDVQGADGGDTAFFQDSRASGVGLSLNPPK